MRMAAVDLKKLYPRYFGLPDDRELTIYQSEVGDVGCVVWDAALVLCSFLVKSSGTMKSASLEGKSVIDLGSGTGAVGLVTSCLGARSAVTDLSDFVPLMQHNISQNKDLLEGSCTAHSLVWGNKTQIQTLLKTLFPNGVDYITMADCVYYEESVEPLVETVKHFSSPKTTVYCSYEERELGNKAELQAKFLKLMEAEFDITEIPPSLQDPEFNSPDIHVLKFMLKN